MHPLIERGHRLLVYLALFTPVAGLLVELLRLTAGGERWALWLLLQPPLWVHAMTCLASWYLCRSWALGKGGAWRVVAVQGFATTLASLWLLATTAFWQQALERWGVDFPADLLPRGALQIGLVGFFLYALAVVGHYLYLAILASQAAESHSFELRLLAQEAELRALRSQLDPHFLFNSLNSIGSLVGSDPTKARAMCWSLAAFLRQSLKIGALELIPLRDELDLVESYLSIEKIRFGDRLRVELEADDSGPLLPPLILQPLVENAVRHGIAQRLEGGTLALKSERLGSHWVLRVSNECDPDRRRGMGTGIGLQNVARRLQARYGASSSIKIRETDESFEVELRIPLENAEP